MDIKRNMIIWAELKNSGRSVQSGIRPCIVISNDIGNKHSPVYTVIPGTTKDKREDFPVHALIKPAQVKGKLYKDTVFMGEQICTIGKDQIVDIAGIIKDEEIINQIDSIIRREFALGSE